MKANSLDRLLPFASYDHVIVSFSGGKDSQACVLSLLEQGVAPEKMELWHQHVDGAQAGRLMDWPCTPDYCRKWAEAMGLKHRSQWKDGGFEGEMLRDNEPTKGVYAENDHGKMVHLPPTTRAKPGTRRKFPQVSADLSVRWCSAYLKIDVAGRALNNDPRLSNARILYISGERRQESAARSKYNEMELHRCHGKKRLVHHWRPIIDWKEDRVWSIIQKHGLVAHPAYRLGWGRLSCLACIFGNDDQWASVQYLARGMFDKIGGYERDFGTTIHRSLPIIERADRGKVFDATLNAPESLKQQAMAKEYIDIVKINPADWALPAGAFKETGGPI